MRPKYTFLAALVLVLMMPRTSFAGPPRCFLHGLIRATDDNPDQKHALTDMIRLHFDAEDQAKCVKLLHAYCLYNIKEKFYTSDKLVGSFTTDVDKVPDTNFRFAQDCKVIQEDKDGKDSTD